MSEGESFRVLFLLGGMGTGGAERQLLHLSASLAERAHEVRVFLYGGVEQADRDLFHPSVTVEGGPGGGWWAKVCASREFVHEFRPQVIHGVMKRASALAVLARGLRSGTVVLANDLSTATYAPARAILWPALVAFGLAHGVVTQTNLNRRSLERLAPWLKGKVTVIRNGVDTDAFAPLEGGSPAKDPGSPGIQGTTTSLSPFRFACVGTVYQLKNPVRLVKAVAMLEGRDTPPFHVDWYGRFGQRGDGAPSEAYTEALRVIREAGVDHRITFHGETKPIQPAYHGADALVHPSIQEGFPNAVVEGMACGLPLVVGRVSDLPLVVETAHNGFVFDETDPASIADAMERMLRIPAEERAAMGRRSRHLAVEWFGMDRFVDEFEALYRSLVAQRG